MILGTQLFLGAEEKKTFSSADIETKIIRTQRYFDLKKLMIWDVNPSDITKRIVDFCNKKDIETYLWHPVLADMNNIEVTIENMAQIPFHRDLNSLSGMWEKIGQGEENFLFADPAEQEIKDRTFENFEALMSEYNFDGVFLDRIRYASPVNGFESIFSTFMTSYRKYCLSTDTDFAVEKQKLVNFYKEIRNWDDRKLDTLNSFDEIFEDFQSFFKYKNEQIYKIVKNYKQWAADRNKKIGLDLLSSGFSFFTGQDYSMLSTQCDWIKDMSYCYGMGPAALPLEIISLVNGFRTLSSGISEKSFLRFLERHTGFTLPESVSEIYNHGIDPINTIKELQMANKKVSHNTPVYSGLEIVNSPYFATNITEEMVGLYSDLLGDGVAGIIASWNILHIPDSHFKVLGRRCK